MSHRAKRGGTVGILGSMLMVISIIGWAATPADATVFANNNLIMFAGEGEATPYPSTIGVSSAGLVTDVNVTLHGLTHDLPADIDILLIGPGGQGVVLMADSGSGFAITGLDLTFDDAAASSLPAASAITARSYKPTDLGAFSEPTPGGPFGNTLSVFDGASPDGSWRLFVLDDNNNATIGSISGGWSLDVKTIAIASFTPPSGEVGDIVTIAGTGFTGATAVKFGGASAAFTVDSAAQITATVSAGAVTGPVSISSSSVVVSSSSDFVVMHPRDISFNLNGHKARGMVAVEDGFAACGSTVPIKVQHLEHGRWRTVAGAVTKHDGSYKAVGLDDPGKYRAVARKTTLGSGDVCLKRISPIARV